MIYPVSSLLYGYENSEADTKQVRGGYIPDTKQFILFYLAVANLIREFALYTEADYHGNIT